MSYDRLRSGRTIETGLRLKTLMARPGGGSVSGGQLMMTIEGDLVVGTGALRFYNHLGRMITLSAVYAAVATAPTGAAILLDLHKAGTTIFTNQAHRPQIAAGANEGSTTTIDVATLNEGEYLTLDIDQIGSTVAGSNLTVVVAYS